MVNLYGIDVSRHNGAIDWTRVASDGVRFAMLRAATGSQSGRINPDSRFAENLRGASAASIPVGVYLYSYARTPDAAKTEAQNLVAMLATSKAAITWPVVYDLEEIAQAKLGRDICTGMVNAFLAEVEKAGYRAMLYTNPAWLTSYLNPADIKHDLWLASWTMVEPSRNQTIWQYSSTGSVAGITGPVDLNIAHKDYAAKEELGMLYKTVGDVPYGEMRETIRALVQHDVLRGGADGNINVPHEIVRAYVVNRRAGAYAGIGIGKGWDAQRVEIVRE